MQSLHVRGVTWGSPQSTGQPPDTRGKLRPAQGFQDGDTLPRDLLPQKCRETEGGVFGGSVFPCPLPRRAAVGPRPH